MTKFSRFLRAAALVTLVSTAVTSADAQRRGGGGGASRSASGGSHGSAGTQHRGGSQHANANRGGAHHANTNRTATANRSNVNRTATANRSNVNRNTNVNNVNVNRNVNVNGNGYGYNGGYHPVARGMAVGAIAVTTAAVIGSAYHTLPSNCATVVRSGMTYHHCGSAWYHHENGEYIAVVAP